MNQLSLVIVALVAFTYFGGSYVPKVLKSNKQMLLGVVGGLVLGSFFGVGLEGIDARERDVIDVIGAMEGSELGVYDAISRHSRSPSPPAL